VTRKLQELESKIKPERLQELKLIAQCVSNLGTVENSYFNLVHKENVSEREGLHPFAIQIESGTAGVKIGDEFAHPINYFLQQEGMNKLWAKRSGLKVGGGGGSSGASQQAKVEETKQAAPAEPEVS
jgi:hypothetical protein